MLLKVKTHFYYAAVYNKLVFLKYLQVAKKHV